MEKNNHDFLVPIVDTDSITISKKDGKEFSEEEIENLTKEINSIFGKEIKWEFEFYIPQVIVIKSKNYILFDGKKIKLKGSALKATTKEPALKEFIQEIINSMISHTHNYNEIYNKYVTEIMDVKDMKRWCSRKTISDKVLNPSRSNEQNILDAITDSDYQEGDRCYVYFRTDGTLCLLENFNNDYDKDRLLGKLYDTSEVFNTIIPEGTFLNYKLKRNKKLLESLTERMKESA